MTQVTLDQAIQIALQHHQAGRLAEAEGIYRQILDQQPNHPDALNWVGVLASQVGRHEAAMELIRRAIQLKPNYAEAHHNAGVVLRKLGKPEDAIAAHREAILLKPYFSEAYRNMSAAMMDLGRFHEAIDSCKKAIQLQPDHAEAHFNLSSMLLLVGDFQRGWEEFEWRWKQADYIPRMQQFSQPRWAGEPLNGRTILLHPEQGFGDTLQFVRYAPLVAARGGSIILGCVSELHRLLKDVPGISKLLPGGEPLPQFDFYCPLLSLPRVFGTTSASIPNSIPYLGADARLSQVWKSALAGTPQGQLNVGLAWAGESTHANDKNRSMTLKMLAPLAAVKGVGFHSLQKGPAVQQVGDLDAGINVIDYSNKVIDFAETAALIANLDLIITVDTAVAHLAGAMGKPVWVLLPFVPDWRWMLHREDSPWYPTMRLFRQKSIGNWTEVIERVAEDLARLAETSVTSGELQR